MLLLDRVRHWARAAPDRVAHRSGARVLTYGALAEGMTRTAAFVRGTPGRAPVAVLGHKEPEMLVGFLGVLEAGRPYLPLDTTLPGARVDSILRAAGAELTLTPEGIASFPAAEPGGPRAGDPEAVCYVMFTSGSTGEPKGVMITAGCISAFVQWMLDEQGFAEGETFLNVAPFSFDLSVMDTYLSVATGGTLVSLTRDEIGNPRRLHESLARSGVTTWVSTPSFARLCLAEPTFGAGRLPGVRRFLFCGETLPPEVASGLLDRFPAAAVWNLYGPTEATVATTSIRIDRAVLGRGAPLPVGYPMPGSRILVTSDTGTEVPEGSRGQIVITGPHVSPGYLGRPDLTERAFFVRDGVRAYRTGDVGYLSGGLLFFGGREDDQVKVRGYRIELGDVEANLRALPGVRDAVAVPDHRGAAEGLAAFVVLAEPPREGSFEAARALRLRLAERIPEYMVPQRILFLDALPMNRNGKIDRVHLSGLLR